MKKKIISMLCTLTILAGLCLGTINTVKAEEDRIKVDGSYLTMQEEAFAVTPPPRLRGQYMMDGESSIGRAAKGRIYACGSTTANTVVDLVGVTMFVDQYDKKSGDWWQITYFDLVKENVYYASINKNITVPSGYFYRVRSDHYAGMDDAPMYDEAVTCTDGIWID